MTSTKDGPKLQIMRLCNIFLLLIFVTMQFPVTLHLPYMLKKHGNFSGIDFENILDQPTKMLLLCTIDIVI